MKHLKYFETGEWTSDIDWEYVKNNPDDDSEEAQWIKQLEQSINLIKWYVENENDGNEDIHFNIINIKGFDMYQGPYGEIEINNNTFRVWGLSGEYELWIENFPTNNMDDNENPGFKGELRDLVNVILNYYKPTRREAEKYNL